MTVLDQLIGWRKKVEGLPADSLLHAYGIGFEPWADEAAKELATLRNLLEESMWHDGECWDCGSRPRRKHRPYCAVATALELEMEPKP